MKAFWAKHTLQSMHVLGKPLLWVFFLSLKLECKENNQKQNNFLAVEYPSYILSNCAIPVKDCSTSLWDPDYPVPIFTSIHIFKNIQPNVSGRVVQGAKKGHVHLGDEGTPGPTLRKAGLGECFSPWTSLLTSPMWFCQCSFRSEWSLLQGSRVISSDKTKFLWGLLVLYKGRTLSH